MIIRHHLLPHLAAIAAAQKQICSYRVRPLAFAGDDGNRRGGATTAPWLRVPPPSCALYGGLRRLSHSASAA